MKRVVEATLASRSHRDSFFDVVDATSLEAECVFLVLLAEGEPPLSVEDVTSWNDHAATVSGDKETCCVQVMRGICCLSGAQGALERLLYLYGTDYDDYEEGDGNWPEGGLLQELLMELDADSVRCYYETDRKGREVLGIDEDGDEEGTVTFSYPLGVWR
jgi:hypothetical protein